MCNRLSMRSHGRKKNTFSRFLSRSLIDGRGCRTVQCEIFRRKKHSTLIIEQRTKRWGACLLTRELRDASWVRSVRHAWYRRMRSYIISCTMNLEAYYRHWYSQWWYFISNHKRSSVVIDQSAKVCMSVARIWTNAFFTLPALHTMSAHQISSCRRK